MRTLFLAWQAPESCAWYPVGRLDADITRHAFIFQYTCGALDAQAQEGFDAVSAFPELHRRYQSSELFSFFRNRVINSRRRGFAEYVQSLDMDENTVDPLAILAVTGGERQTDNFEVFPKLVKDSGNRFVCRFFLHGVRHCNESARERAFLLRPGEELRVSVELNNPATGLAVLLAKLVPGNSWRKEEPRSPTVKVVSRRFADCASILDASENCFDCTKASFPMMTW